MKINWKLVIGVVVGLAVLALVGYGFFSLGQNRMAAMHAGMSDNSHMYNFRGPVGEDGERGFEKPGFKGNGPDKQKGDRFEMGMKRNGPFGFGLMAIGGLLRLVVPLAVLGVAIYLAYKQGQKSVQKVIEIETDEPKTKKTSK